MKDDEFEFIPYENDELIVSFAPHNNDGKFFKYKTLKNNQQTNLLFLNNKNNWYLEEDEGLRYKNFLTNFINEHNFDKNKIMFFGSSMGGYGALYHGILQGVNIFSTNPQISKEIIFKHYKPEGNYYIRSLLDVELINPSLVHQDNIEFMAYILVGDNIIDKENLRVFLEIINNKNIKIIIEKINNPVHDFYTHSYNNIMDRYNILNALRRVSYSNY